MTYGECNNFDCPNANKHVSLGDDVTEAYCSECGLPLRIVSPEAPNSRIVLIAAVLGVIVIAIAVLVFRAAPWKKDKPVEAVATPVPTSAPVAKTELTLCGSYVVGARLAPQLTSQFLAARGFHDVVTTGGGSDEKAVQGTQGAKQSRILIRTGGSSTAFTGLHRGSCQIGMSSRRITKREAANLHGLGDMFSSRAEHVVGVGAIALIVSPENPVSELTTAKLSDILGGRVVDWKQLGGRPGPIKILVQDDRADTLDIVQSSALSKPNAPVRRADGDAIAKLVSQDSAAIGLTEPQNVGGAKLLKLASGGAALLPTDLNVGREAYPLTRRLYFYTRTAPDRMTAQFMAYVESVGGQQAANAYDPWTVPPKRPPNVVIPPHAPPDYRRLLDHYVQARVNIYFETGSDKLDNKAKLDIARLAESLSGRSVVLAGFADNTGTLAGNQLLSEQRAAAAAVAMRSAGIKSVSTLGFGQAVPIRDNRDEQGRQKNRRVEIFATEK